jgi:Cation transporting ATPase, C-terminus
MVGRAAKPMLCCCAAPQLFNMLNCRKIDDEYNILSGLMSSHVFLYIWAFIFGMQIIIVEFLGGFFKVHRQSWQEWLVALAIGFGSIPLSWFIKALSRCAPPAFGPKFHVYISTASDQFAMHATVLPLGDVDHTSQA